MNVNSKYSEDRIWNIGDSRRVSLFINNFNYSTDSDGEIYEGANINTALSIVLLKQLLYWYWLLLEINISGAKMKLHLTATLNDT